MKKIVLLILVFLFTGCSSVKTINDENSKLNNNSIDDGLWVKSEIREEEIHNENILKDVFSISLWYRPTSNKPSDTILFIGDKDNYYKLSPSLYAEEEYYGLTLSDNDNPIISADKNDTLKSNRYNHIVVNFNTSKTNIYLNGELVMSKSIKNNLSSNNIYIGYDPYEDHNIVEGFYSDLKISSGNISEEKIIQEYRKGLPKVLLDTINISNANDLIYGYWIDSYEIENHPVVWSVSNKEVIDYRGVIVKEVDEDTEVILKATLEIDGYKASKDFKVIVRVEDDNRLLQRDLVSLDTYIQAYMHSNSELPSILTNGSSVSWSISNNGIILDNYLLKTSENSVENIELKASVKKGDISFDKTYNLILLDEIEGYIMSYFNGELGEEKGYLAYSYDGLTWKKLNVEISTDLGSQRIRDPEITRDKNGEFIYLATEGFDNPNIYIFNAPGLLDFSDQRLVQVAYYDEGLKMTGERAWAPEITYDITSEEYFIYFSDNGYIDEKYNQGGPIYAITSKDLNEFSYPFIYFNPGYSVIDATILSLDGSYWMFYKDERKAAQTIFYASSNTLGGFNKAYDDKFLNLVKYMEGPFTFKDKNGGYFLYIDNYPNNTFYASHFTQLEESDIEWFEQDLIKLPEEDVRHGSVIEVTKKELDKIIEKYK